MNSDFEACSEGGVILPILSFLKQNDTPLGGVAAQEGRWGSPVREFCIWQRTFLCRWS